jgi:YD repeat-containing protein
VTYTYPATGPSSVRPHAVSTVAAASYTYDNNGNTLTGNGRTLSYDFENRPTSITRSGVTATMVYDGDGGRVKKTVSGITTIYIGKLHECCRRMPTKGFGLDDPNGRHDVR